ncbi:hypothetical protein F8C76_12460 [Flagellimonas olearia]|uniref:Glycosyltransferase n=1 Tax=Flagellimonas olearia TaxID=552546 RepID=A0A6I1DZB6_9FLAO|nr:hypothetical protein [Allomuricauda olearia]KAB7528667.1 hypothetical protein F8C76_12460 [Allomuricauda olearia]
MRIAYLLEVNPFVNSGIVKKINAQISYWSSEGHDVLPLIIWPFPKEKTKNKFLNGQILNNSLLNKLPDHFLKTYLTKISTSRTVGKKLKDFNPDILYIRQNIWYPGITPILKRHKSILELNSVDFMEMEFYSSIKKRIYLFGKDRIMKSVSGLVAVSPDILKYYDRYKISSTVVSNGIPLQDFRGKKKQTFSNHCPSFVFVGSNNMKWHGLDKIFELANRKPDWNFNIVGYYQKDFDQIRLPNLNFLGWLDKAKLEEVYLKSNFGIGSFSNHLVGKEIDSTLKVREYLAYGLPVILGHHDVDFMESKDVAFKITDNKNQLIQFPIIEAYVDKYKDYVVDEREIMVIDSSSKEKERLRFFNQIKEQ